MTTENTSTLPNDDLLSLLRKREEREAREADQRDQERKVAADEHQRRVSVREAGDKFYWTELEKRQGRCDHRKGTSGKGPKAKIVDYMVNRHTFASGVTRVKCEKCKFPWFPGDTAELAYGSWSAFLSNSKRKPNPTKLSYAQAYNMTLEENTTNKESRAEMLAQGPTPQVA